MQNFAARTGSLLALLLVATLHVGVDARQADLDFGSSQIQRPESITIAAPAVGPSLEPASSSIVQVNSNASVPGAGNSAHGPALVAQPARLAFDATLNQPVILRMEVTSLDALPGSLDLQAEGIRIQREIHPLAGKGVLFLIEPDTSQPDSVHGCVNIIDGTGAVLCAVPVTGEIRPCVRASPPRIFLEGLEYGATSGRMVEKRIRLSSLQEWKILGVDTTDIPGAVSEIVTDTGEGKELTVRFAEDALKEGQPFGAFIKRDIRIRTDVAAQPEVRIPIEAMLSINKTRRDFHTYVFHGNERWQGCWGTPNIAAAIIAPLALLLLGWGALAAPTVAARFPPGCPSGWQSRAARRLRRLPAAIMFVLSTAGMVLLVKTYSRGGWAAFGAGLALMLAVMKGRRRILLAGAAVFVAAVLLLPAGLERVASAGSATEDRSIGHRLLVWRGALEMIADHPWRGVGAGRFGDVFKTYYQEPSHKDDYTTAINDYLTYAAERGLVPVLAVLFLLAGVLTASVRTTGAGAWNKPVAGAVTALGVAPAFSSVIGVRDVSMLAAASVGFLVLHGGVRMLRTRGNPADASVGFRARDWKLAAAAGLAAVGTTAVCVSGAALARRAYPVVHYCGSGGTSMLDRIEYLPGPLVPRRGTILYLPGRQEGLSTNGRCILRPLAEHGWRAVAIDLCMFDQEAVGQVVSTVRNLEGPTIILAEGARSRVAMGAERFLRRNCLAGLVLVDPTLFSELAECDQSKATAILPDTGSIASGQWQAFKRDGRSGLPSIIETCEALAVNSKWRQPGGQAAPANHSVWTSGSTP